MKIRNPVLAFAILLGASQLPMSSASAQPAATPAAEADAHYKRAVTLFGEADYGVALIEFKRAYEIAPAFQVLYNIGETYYQLQDYAGALKTLEKYLADGGDKVPAERKAEVTKELEKLRLRVARVEIDVQEPGVDIAVDDVAVGKTPLAEAILVSAGRRKITATAPGGQPVVKTVDLAGGDKTRVKFEISKAPAATATATTSAAPSVPTPPEGREYPVWPWVTTGVLVAGAGVFGGLALAASGDQKALLNKADQDPKAIKDAHDKVATMAGVTDGLLGAAVIMGVVSVALTATASPKKAAQQTGFSPVIQRLSVGPNGAFVTGAF